VRGPLGVSQHKTHLGWVGVVVTGWGGGGEGNRLRPNNAVYLPSTLPFFLDFPGLYFLSERLLLGSV
jgi:hypothetical protein